jgi:hypothetical protein
VPAAGSREGGSTHPIKARNDLMRTSRSHTAREDQPSRSALEDLRMPLQARLAAAWTSFMFLYIYVDYFALYKPGVIDDLLEGRVFEFQISQTLLTAFLALMAIPILMIVASVVLPARTNRVINLAVASVYVPVSAFNAVGESWTWFYGLSIGLEVLLLGFILRSAWTWPRADRAAVEHARVRAHA